MKRPFSFGLAPIKVPPKTEIKAVKDPNSKPLSRRDSCSPPPSPFICRRELPAKTEAQLRAACALILENYKPSGHVFEDNAKPKLDFDGLNRAMRERRRNEDAGQQQHTVDNRANLRKLPKPEPLVKDLYPGAGSTHAAMKANSGRRRDDLHPRAVDTERAARKAGASQPSADRPKTAPLRNTMDSDDSSSLKTPLTSSTGCFHNNASTAPTSAAFSSSPGSKRDSRHAYPNDNAVAAADAAAAEWMKQELERRRQNMLSLGEPPAFNSTVRHPSRSTSIRSEFRELIRPLSRSASKDSMRSNSSAAREREPERSSGHGWRSWSLHRKTSLSSFKDSRPSSSRGRSEIRSDEAPRGEVNLNRELPPLPSLDKWEDHAAESAKAGHSQTPSTHIANLMLPKGRDHQQPFTAARHKHRRSGSDSLAHTFPKDTTLYSPAGTVKMPRPTSGLPSHPPNPRYDSSITFDGSMDPAQRSRPNEEGKKRKHQHSKSVSSVSQMTPSVKVSIDQYRYEPPNFSRKISMDVAGRPYNDFPDPAEATPKSSSHEKMQKLRKAVSGWMLNKRKDKKENGIGKPQQDGVTGGIVAHPGAAHAAVVKY